MTTSGEVLAGKVAILPLGEYALLVRFGTALEAEANLAAVAFAQTLAEDRVAGVIEIVPSLVSVLVRYDPERIGPTRLAGELSLRLTAQPLARPAVSQAIPVRFGGDQGEDLDTVAESLGMSTEAFIALHNAAPLRVLATGFAPGFVYCGFHEDKLTLPRRAQVRTSVPAGSVLFAAGQTAIAATEIPTGWHVIGRTEFRNFDPSRTVPTSLAAGDLVRFEVAL